MTLSLTPAWNVQRTTPDDREPCNCCGALCQPEHLSFGELCPDCAE